MDSDNCAEYIWEIENFASIQDEDSTLSFATKNSENQFYLYLHAKNSMPYLEEYVLMQIDQYNENDSLNNIKVLCTLSLLNQNDEKCLTDESLVVFKDDDNSPVKGGLFMFKYSFVSNPENALLTNGKLRIHCVVKVLDSKSFQNTKITNIFQNEIPTENLKALSDYESLLESCKHSDVVFVVGKKEFKLHKNILSARSPVFAAMFDSDLSENKQNRVEIPDVEVEVFEELVRFIYTGKLPEMDQYALELFVASDKYQFESIKEMCERSLCENLSIETLASVLTHADMHSASLLKSKCMEFFTKNAANVMNTESWNELVKTKNYLAMELFKELANKAEHLLNNIKLFKTSISRNQLVSNQHNSRKGHLTDAQKFDFISTGNQQADKLARKGRCKEKKYSPYE